MNNLGTVWVVISADEAHTRLVEFIDNGNLAEAVGYSSALNSLVDKMKKFVQQYGGNIPIHLYERIIMQVPSSAAEQLPAIISGYSEALNNKIAVGIGLTMHEASQAAKKSYYTGSIELFDPVDTEGEDFYKSGMNPRRWKSDVILPPNTFDPTIPDGERFIDETEEIQTGIPSLKEALQTETELIQAMAGQLGMNQMQESMKQAQQQQSPEQASQEQPRDLLEALNGGKVEGHEPETEEEMPPKEQELAGELEEEIEEAEGTTADDKIAMQLDKIKNQIPQIMGLATSNPKAFKQTMDMINKLIQLAHNRSKATKKSETREKLDELVKAFNKRLGSKPKTGGHVFPPGTRLGRWKKVMINGKETWRELSTGQVKDNTGEPLSVKEHNKQANDNDREG